MASRNRIARAAPDAMREAPAASVTAGRGYLIASRVPHGSPPQAHARLKVQAFHRIHAPESLGKSVPSENLHLPVHSSDCRAATRRLRGN